MNIGWKLGRRFVLFGLSAGVGASVLPAVAAPIKVDSAQQLVDYIHEQLSFLIDSFPIDLPNDVISRAWIAVHVKKFMDSLPQDRVQDIYVGCNEDTNFHAEFDVPGMGIRTNVSFRLPEDGGQYVFMYETRSFA